MKIAAMIVVVAGLAGSASGQLVSTSVSPPVVDRWMYPFGSEVGTRATVPVFGSQNVCGPDARFDDRDSQVYLCFQTSAAIESGWPASAYRLRAMTLSVRSADTTPFVYDGSADAIETFFAPGDSGVPCPPDPVFVSDSDPGRVLEVFAAAFRNGFTPQTYGESSPFKPGSAFVPPWTNVRNVYPIGFDPASGAAVDASNPIKDRTLRFPAAVGSSPTGVPGQPVPDGTEYVFTLPVHDSGSAGLREYVQSGLASGRVALLIAGVFEAQQQVAGSYPNIYTKEADPLLFPNAAAPRLTVEVFVCRAEFNGDANLDADDLADYINAYFALPQGAGTDINRDGETNADDLGDYINVFFAGCE